MNGSKQKRNGSFYSSIFLTLTISIVATILIVSSILYLNFDNIITRQTFAYTMDNLQQISQEAVLMKINTGTLAKQIFIDAHISKLRNYPLTDLDAMDKATATAQMKYYRATSPFIESIYIYNAMSQIFYVSSDYGENSVLRREEIYDKGIVEIIDNYKDYQNLMPTPRRIKTNQRSLSVYTFILHDGIGDYPPGSIIIVNYLEKYLFEDISGLDKTSGRNIFTIDGNGVVVTDSPGYPMLKDISEIDFVKRVMSDSSAGYFITFYGGVKTFVAYTKPNLLGWRYISTIPYGEIAGNIARMRNFTILAGAVILFLGLAVSILVSRRLSTNVDNKLSKLEQLEYENRTHMNLKREEYLKKLLLCEEKQELDNVAENFKSLGINMDIEGWFTLLIIRIDRYGDFTKKYEGNENGLMKFAIMNIAQEILSSCNCVFAVDMNTDRIAFFLNQPADAPDAAVEIPEDLIKDVQASVIKFLEISVSVTLSTPAVTAEGLGYLYRQAVEASFHRMFRGYCCIIYSENVATLEARQYEYPERKEKLLVSEFMLGKTEEAMKLVKEILEDTAEYSYAAFNIAVVHLGYAVGNAFRAIRKDKNSYGELNINSILQSSAQVEVIDDIYRQFEDIFNATALMLDEKKDWKHVELAEKTMELIGREYMNPNLSLESIAETMSMSSSYIGRLFKKQTMKTILDYITEVRMKKARQLLSETRFSVGEIAEKTGFTNSPYFYKAFKRAHGITPADYRKSEKTISVPYARYEKSETKSG